MGGISAIFASAAPSTQAMIERIYVKEANDILGSALGGLEQALLVSSALLQTLGQLQYYKNQLVVQSRSVPPFSQGSFSTAASAYVVYASTYFGKIIAPSFAISSTSILNGVSLLTLQLFEQLLQLSALSLNNGDPTGIYQQALNVFNDLGNGSGATGWVMDNYNTSGSTSAQAGQYQTDLSLALTSAMSLSDSQKEQVRRYLFIFEEYYKSAAAMLSAITSIIQTMAQNIAR